MPREAPVTSALRPLIAPVPSRSPHQQWPAPYPILRPGQLVLVVKQVAQLRPGNGGETAGGGMIGFALELDRADEIAAGPGGEPALDQCQEPRRVADDIRKQPIDRADGGWIEREGAVRPVLDPRQARDCRRQRRFVDADDMRPHALQGPAPAAGADAEIETPLARPGPAPDQGQRLPKF